MKWASALLRDSSGTAAAEPQPSAAKAQASAAGPSSGAADADADRDAERLLRKLHRAAPELEKYHVLLIPKEERSADDARGAHRDPSHAS